MKRFAISLLCLSALAGLSSGQVNQSGPRIVIGPNILAGRDGDFYHTELTVAANPKNPRNLVGAAITPTAANNGAACRVYATLDGGYTWSVTIMPEQAANGGADPQVAFSPQGTAYFAALSRATDGSGRRGTGLYFYRSEDGGVTWAKPTDLGVSYDHPQIAIDHTYGKFAGRIYIGVLWGRDYSLGVFRSDDGGRTFTGPVKAIDGGGTGVNVSPLMVLSDGTLAMTYVDFQIDQAKRKSETKSGAWLITSKDGGVTFSAPVKVATLHHAASPDDQIARLGNMPVYATNNMPGSYRDRIYTAWADFASGKPRILFTSSTDGGQSWKAPIPIDPSSPGDSIQYQPAMTVNSQGVLGIMWFDSRGLKADYSEYHAMFTVSVDGGESFLPPVRLSSAPSYRWGPGNFAFSPSTWSDPMKSIRVTFLSAASRWGNGGDYIGLTADAEGVFHPFWPDSRTGTFQAMTSRVRVELPEKAAAPGSRPPIQAATATAMEKVEVPLTEIIQVIADKTTYDPATQELLIPIRLKNVSNEAIYKPVIVSVKTFGSGMGDILKDKAPLILNSTNGRRQDGAIFDYSSSLRDLESLEPNAQTESIIWRFKLSDPLQTPDMHLSVTGFVMRKK